MNRQPGLAIAAGIAALGIAAAGVPLAAATAEGNDSGVNVVNTETVQAYTDATGKVTKKRIYEQLALTGQGKVSLANPSITEGLRNLNEFGGFQIGDGEQIVNLELDGEKNLRSVADFDGELPLDLQIDYQLDGQPIKPQDLVGRNGTLQVTYTVKNVTSRLQPVTFTNGKGKVLTKDVAVFVPMVGSLSTSLPPEFRNVSAPGANLAGDGKGGTKVSFTMTLVPPLGADLAVLRYSAKVSDAIVPRSSLTALPIDPMKSPTFKSAGDSYASGATTGAELTDGAAQIDSNLLKLRDGASELLAGLIKLRDGAGELSAGLNREAVPGSRQLADGAGELGAGLKKLDDGAGRLADGTKRLADGTGKAKRGGEDLTTGLKQISNGLGQLAGAEGLPGAKAGVEQLRAGVDALLAGLGGTGEPTSLIGGITALEAGLAQLEAGQTQLIGGLAQLAGGLPQAKGGVDQVKGGLDAAVAGGGSADQLIGGLTAVGNLPSCAADPTCAGTIAALKAGATSSKQNLQQAAGGLGQVSAGLGQAIAGLTGQIQPGAVAVRDGLSSAKAGAGRAKDGAQRIRGGVDAVGNGLDQLAAGLTKAIAGVLQLNAGGQAAVAGASQLSAGLGDLDDGAGELADGAGQLKGGTGEAAAGGQRLAAGAGELADGLGEAAAGSTQLADGLEQAAAAAPALPDGAQRLSTEGTSKLVTAGNATARKYGKLYATLEAGAERAHQESMIVGAPKDALGLAAYSYEIVGENGADQRNQIKAVLAALMLMIAAGVLTLRRRLG